MAQSSAAPGPSDSWTPGINFSAKTLLEVAIMLLGASISTQKTRLQLRHGAPARTVEARVVADRVQKFGLWNSAIAAVGPVIGTRPADIATSIAFTAVLGVVVVFGLPLLIPLLQLSSLQYVFWPV